MEITLGNLKKLLYVLPDNECLCYGFRNTHSYRGMYNCVAFEPSSHLVEISEMRNCVEEALTRMYTGWKGGDYTYDSETPVFFAEEGTMEEGAGFHEYKLTLPIRQYWFTLITAMNNGETINTTFHY